MAGAEQIFKENLFFDKWREIFEHIFKFKHKLKQIVDALVQGAEEGRIWRRYSSGRGQNPLIRRFPNEVTHSDENRNISCAAQRIVGNRIVVISPFLTIHYTLKS